MLGRSPVLLHCWDGREPSPPAGQCTAWGSETELVGSEPLILCEGSRQTCVLVSSAFDPVDSK